MDKLYRARIGLSAEFRVMSELLIRGHNPAKSYLDNGADLILDNGIRIEVKSAHRNNYRKKNVKPPCYLFSFLGGSRNKKVMKDFDYAICWALNDDLFYIIPSKEINGIAVQITDTSNKYRKDKSKYSKYKNAWKLLENGG